jgi:hypothetical protein
MTSFPRAQEVCEEVSRLRRWMSGAAREKS